MLAIRFRSIFVVLLFVSFGNIAHAAPRWTPPTETLPPEKLDWFLQTFDSLARSDHLSERDGALALVLGIIPRGERFSNNFYCRYDNPEIIDRFVDLYLEEVARVQAGQRTPASDYNDHGDAEYLMALAAAGESTFDPRLYDDILHANLHFWENLRYIYLAAVNPERTLDYLFNREIKEIGFGGKVRRSFVILSYMTVESPQALGADREGAITFITKHARYFAGGNLGYILTPDKVYLNGHDYYVRSDALDVLELIGTVTEVPLVEEIIHNAQKVDLRKIRGGFGRTIDKYLDHGYEQIRDKGLRIIEILRQRSPSQR